MAESENSLEDAARGNEEFPRSKLDENPDKTRRNAPKGDIPQNELPARHGVRLSLECFAKRRAVGEYLPDLNRSTADREHNPAVGGVVAPAAPFAGFDAGPDDPVTAQLAGVVPLCPIGGTAIAGDHAQLGRGLALDDLDRAAHQLGDRGAADEDGVFDRKRRRGGGGLFLGLFSRGLGGFGRAVGRSCGGSARRSFIRFGTAVRCGALRGDG